MNTTTDAVDAAGVEQGLWELDPGRSHVEFRTRGLWGLQTVRGRFERYAGTMELTTAPAISLTVEADSLDTGNRKRDAHLRTEDFFDVERHPQVRFVSDTATLEGDRLSVRGRLHAAGNSVPLAVKAAVREVDGELEIEASAEVDQRQLGMTFSPMGSIRAPSTLTVRGRLIRN